MAYPGSGTPIVNPPIPYVGAIPGGLSPGKMIFIQGTPSGSGNPNSFQINLSQGYEVQPSTALHFAPRLNENCVVRNTCSNGSWASEERGGGIPFSAGQHFEVIILVQNDCYRIAVNGQHFTEFRHRLPKEQVQNLIIKGSVFINSIRYEGGTGPSYPQPPPQPPAPSYSNQPIMNPPVPLNTFISGGLYPGRMISISGTPHPSASRFSINFMQGDNNAFHFNPRFDQNVVVRNSQINGAWGSEERTQTYFPFVRSGRFEILILVEPHCYKVAVNNQHFTSYNHRYSALQQICNLNIAGDVSLDTVRIQ